MQGRYLKWIIWLTVTVHWMRMKKKKKKVKLVQRGLCRCNFHFYNLSFFQLCFVCFIFLFLRLIVYAQYLFVRGFIIEIVKSILFSDTFVYTVHTHSPWNVMDWLAVANFSQPWTKKKQQLQPIHEKGTEIIGNLNRKSTLSLFLDC